jgi:TRAP-type C4-dicarboxylate transport system substrate-binding protein
MKPLLLALCALLLVAAVPAAQKPVEFKIATLVPEGSLWDKQERAFGEDARAATGERVRFKYYAGGVAGDEPDVLRKMRLGQLHGGVFTLSGLGDVLPDLRVMDIPLFIRSEEEAEHLLRELDGHFRAELEKKGIVVLHWGHVGWMRFFSTKPVTKPADLRALKQFVWAGQGNMARWYQEAGFQPVPLAATDMLTGLKTGLIEALPGAPLVALALQWFRSAPYMLDYPILPLLGAMVVDAKAWQKLSDEDRAAVLAAATRVEERVFAEIPSQEKLAIEEMAKRGLTVTRMDEASQEEWFALADHFAERMSQNMISKEILKRSQDVLKEYRAR